MAEIHDPRIAVYLDFDNIVMSWYDRVHGRNAYSRDRQRIAEDPTAPEIAERLAAATVDVGAIIDFAASYGTVMLTRAYADWSSPVNAEYRDQLVSRAVDLVQLFPAAAYAKNGADIRLAVDTVEDMFRTPDLTHVVIVAGDSDYVPLAQRCRRLGRYVVAMGVAGSTAKSLAAACDEFESYDNLPGVELTGTERSGPSRRRRRAKPEPAASSRTSEDSATPAEEPAEDDPHAVAAALLERALELGDRGDGEWLHSSAVKTHMRRMDPSFSEKALGHRSFSDFLKANADIAELEETGHERLVRAKD
ncbi:NYN domain-containing protein [Brachybacterium sp. J153]|uniref:NYN domain-containing protein n=1 Tax=Brachybacterium sp. J153 TaxID=3116488 RepID=UPI002E768405|nr:NYN domain-containing protein [Brachybacterium sp. J153]MEE1617211.1 NYN domain-containing protein [Brachybacterium sp. J153]